MLRTFLVALGSALACSASAQDYPSRPIRLIVPFAPGGGTDILIRILAPKLGAALGQQLVVENRPGASSIIGTELVARSAPDGYTLLAVDTSFTVNPSLQPKLPYDSLKDLAPVIHLAAAPVILVLHPSVPAQSVKELVALALGLARACGNSRGGDRQAQCPDRPGAAAARRESAHRRAGIRSGRRQAGGVGRARARRDGQVGAGREGGPHQGRLIC